MIGPGLVVAATGVGAGDLVAAAKAGATFGVPILWTALVGAILKFALAEGVARWQLATGTTVVDAWVDRFGPVVRGYVLVYLILWTFVVAAALMSACGLAAHAIFPALSVSTWAILHALGALVFVWRTGYGAVEEAMKVAIGIMVLAIFGSLFRQPLPLADIARGLVIPALPEGSTLLVMGVIGGVGGTVTLLSYNYWIAEKGWAGPGWRTGVRVDLAVGYGLTGIFGIALVALAALVLHPRGITITGTGGVVEMATILGDSFGRTGEIVFLVGFWGAVVSSLLGVWQGVPYLFADFVGRIRTAVPAGDADAAESPAPRVDTRGRWYRGYVLFMTFPPMLLLLLGKPVWLVVAYAALGSLFMPFLAGTLLVLNNRRKWVHGLANGRLANGALLLCMALFAAIAVNKLVGLIR